MNNNTKMFLEIALLTIIYFVGVFVLISVYADHTNQTVIIQSQKRGSVTPNEFPTTHYTNDTNRTLSFTIDVDVSDEEIREMDLHGLREFTVKARGNELSYKHTYPLLFLTGDKTITIPLNDGRLDSYKVCAYFDKYDRYEECKGLNTVKNVTSEKIDMTYQLRFVYEDIKKENGVEDDDFS